MNRTHRIARQSAARTLHELNEEYRLSALQNLSKVYTAHGELIDTTTRAVDEVKQSAELTHKGKANRISEMLKEFRAQGAPLVKEIEHHTTELLSEKAPEYPVPDVSPELLEARLGNARADARMMLDGHDLIDLPKRLADAAQQGDENLKYLLLGTNFADLYITSKTRDIGESQGAAWAPTSNWHLKRDELIHDALTPEQQRVHARVKKLQGLANIPGLANQAQSHLEQTMENTHRQVEYMSDTGE